MGGDMQGIVGVRFEKAGRIYHFDATGLQLRVGDWAIVETTRGQALAQVVTTPHRVDEEERELKPVLRRATARDLLLKGSYASREERALERCREKAAEYDLNIKPVKARYSFDGKQLTIYFFAAEEWVDFRQMAQELARTLKTRVEFHQLGPRDEAKILGGVGICGRPLCCATFLTKFTSIPIKMAKRQNLPLGSENISGRCGYLCCCLSYEDEYYQTMERQFPQIGDEIETPYGPGEVVNVNAIKKSVNVKLQSETTVEIPIKRLNDTPHEQTHSNP